MDMTIQTYMIACAARLVSGNATVNATSGQLLELVPSPEQSPNTSSTWEILDWSMNPDLGFNNTYFNGVSSTRSVLRIGHNDDPPRVCIPLPRVLWSAPMGAVGQGITLQRTICRSLCVRFTAPL